MKAAFARPRPYHLEKRIKAPETPGHPSYPSGHASASYVHAYLLERYFPEHRDSFMKKAYDMAYSREIRAVHFPSDSQAGQEFAFQFVEALFRNSDFLKDAKLMEEELTKAYSNYNAENR